MLIGCSRQAPDLKVRPFHDVVVPESETTNEAEVVEPLSPFCKDLLFVARVADETKWSGEREHGHDVGSKLPVFSQHLMHLVLIE